MKDVLDRVAKKLKIEQRDLLEKDMILHRILSPLSIIFNDNYAFKGGTCLTKCYLGYYRFSEDLDFTYMNQEEFSGMSEKKIRKILSEKISKLLNALVAISEKCGLSFKADKSDTKYVRFGGSNKFLTCKFWYTPEVGGEPTFIKIQISFVDRLLYPVKTKQANHLLPLQLEQEIAFLFPEYTFKTVKLPVYDIREILCEKVRAIVTRRGVKARDFLDMHMICQNTGIDYHAFKKQMIEKIEFMMRYEKYRVNLWEKEFNKDEIIKEEERLILRPIIGFGEFLDDFIPFVEGVAQEFKR